MSTVKLKPVGVIKARLGIEPGGAVQKYFCNECYRFMDKYVPYRDGNLKRNVSLATDGTSITYLSPYAHYQYEGKLYVMDNGKGAYYSPTYGFWSKKGARKHATDIPLNYHYEGGIRGDHWDERMKNAEMEQLEKQVQKYVDTHGGK